MAVVQRVSEAAVEIVTDPGKAARIGTGLMILLGVVEGDEEKDAAWLAAKCAALRIFRDEAGKMNRSVREVGGAALVVSQFTLSGDCRKGNRPSFIAAARSARAEPLYELFCEKLGAAGVPVETGVFGATMRVSLVNDGPVTLLVRSPEKPPPAE